MRLFSVLAIGSVLLLSGCSQGKYPLANRGSGDAQSAEVRFKELLESHDEIVGSGPKCDVRYLGEEAGASFVWALCTAEDPKSHIETSVSAPFRIEGDSVRWPSESSYVADVETLFPDRLAHDILNNANRLKP